MQKLLVPLSFAAVFSLAAAPRAFQADDLKAGDAAPSFSLMGTDGKTHSLADDKGKFVVLAWFPKAMTTGCTLECRSIRDNADVIKAYDVAYFMASVDTPELNKQFSDKENANFPLLSDPDKKVATAYGVVDATHALAQRWTFYIAPDGKLAKVDKDQSKHTTTAGADLTASLEELKVPKRK